jgi:hypothetical protein
MQRHAILDEFARAKEAGRSKPAIEFADFFGVERFNARPIAERVPE